MEGSGTDAGESASTEWLGDYMARVVEYWQRTGQANAELAQRWGDRSLRQDRWTADTVTSDVVEAWEELTPLMGEGLELCIELVQRSLRVGRQDG